MDVKDLEKNATRDLIQFTSTMLAYLEAIKTLTILAESYDITIPPNIQLNGLCTVGGSFKRHDSNVGLAGMFFSLIRSELQPRLRHLALMVKHLDGYTDMLEQLKNNGILSASGEIGYDTSFFKEQLPL